MKHHTIVIHYTENGQSNQLVKTSTSKQKCEDKATELNKVYAPNGNSPDGDEYSIATVIDDALKNKMKFKN